jgi:hypothetical protein
MKHTLQLASLSVATLAALVISGCAAPSAAPTAAAPKAAPASTAAEPTEAKEFFSVLKDGRIYAFGDTRNYFDFLAHGEVTLTRTKIGTGPGGATVVYGITSADVKANKPSMGERILEAQLPAAPNFHGEVFKDGRFYVFPELKDMMPFIGFGGVPYSCTDIGAGPNGETLVWVMNSTSIKTGRPVATMERFKALRAAK